MTEITPTQEPPKPILEDEIKPEHIMSIPLLREISKHIDIANQSYLDLERMKFKVMVDMDRDKTWVDGVWKDCDVYHHTEFCVTLRALFQKASDLVLYQDMQIKHMKSTINEIVNEIKRAPRVVQKPGAK